MIKQLSFSVALALMLPGSAVLTAPSAASKSPIVMQGRVQLDKTVAVDGVQKQVMAEPKVVVPGDRLLCTTTYRNDGAQALSDLVVTNPVRIPGSSRALFRFC